MEKSSTSQLPLTNVMSTPSPGPPRGPMAPPPMYHRSPGPPPPPPPTTFTPQPHHSPAASQFSTPPISSFTPGPNSSLTPGANSSFTPPPNSNSLPTSSPAHFVNASIELPLHYPPGSDSQPDSPYVLFSAHKVLKRKKVASVPSLGFGALVSPGLESASGLEVIERDPYRCEKCGAYSNLYCEVLTGSGKWQCVICKSLNSSEGSYMCNTKEELLSWPELATSAVDYVSGNRRPPFIPTQLPQARSTGPIFLLIDEALDDVDLTHLQASLHAFVDSLPPTTRLGIITYGRTVSVYDFSEGAVVSADTVPGHNSPAQDLLKPLVYGTGLYLSPMHASLPVAHSIFSSLRPYKLNEPEVSRDRCLAAAVEVALGLVRGPTAEISRGIIRRSGGNCRILVCAGGPCTYGPGSVPCSIDHPNYAYLEKKTIDYMEKLGQEARRHGAVVDLLFAGFCPIRVPVLQPLAKSSGGVLILHDDFGEAFGVNLQRASVRASGSNGLFEIRCSDDILVAQVIGPGEEAVPDSHESFKNDTSFRIQMHSVEETQSFAISMETRGDINNDFVYFQFSIRYVTAYQSDVTRVITIRLPVVDSVSAYLSSVNEEVAAVLSAKRTVLRASTSAEAVNMRYQIDERVRDIAHRFGSQMAKSKMYGFPKELQVLAELLFHLRRGPLLGGIIGHEDERWVLRNIFLNASFDLALRMVGPRCLMHREGGTFEELPAYDLAMQSDAALVLDHGTDVFIWLGAELAGQGEEASKSAAAAALAACRTLAEELSERRFPAPRILSLKEGSSQARYVVARLIPAHKDPTYEQEARFPQLNSLTQHQRSHLKSKTTFFHTDDYSFCEWMHALNLLPPHPT